MSFDISPSRSDLTSLSMPLSRSMHVAADGITSFFLWLSNAPLHICTTSPLSVPCRWTLRLPPRLGCCKQRCSEHWPCTTALQEPGPEVVFLSHFAVGTPRAGRGQCIPRQPLSNPHTSVSKSSMRALQAPVPWLSTPLQLWPSWRPPPGEGSLLEEALSPLSWRSSRAATAGEKERRPGVNRAQLCLCHLDAYTCSIQRL